MYAMIKTEFQKIKRYHILLIGLAGMFCSPLLQHFSQLIINEEMRDPHYGFASLMDNTIWGNTQIFMPVLFTLTGGYLINRESTDDTLKNILTVPVSYRRFLGGKLISMGILAVLFGSYSLAVTLAVGLLAKLPGLCFPVLFRGFLQMAALSVFVYIAVLPIIIFCAGKPGLFMPGSVIAFLSGYCVLFFKQGLLRDIYPFSAALTLIGFDSSEYSGASSKGSLPLALLSLGAMLLISAVLLAAAAPPETAVKKKSAKKPGTGRTSRTGRRK